MALRMIFGEKVSSFVYIFFANCCVNMILTSCVNYFVQLTSLFLDNTGRIRIADFSVNARYRFKPIC